ncbi:MAG: glycosyltransferase, partial [Bacteroidales bacterium]|nr:glycosyltransferase [Candidatus Egerieousia equi]
GVGETFLEDEIPLLSEAFDRVIVYPLHMPDNPISNGYSRGDRIAPYNFEVRPPLLDFDNKNRWKLLTKGLFCMSWARGFSYELIRIFRNFLKGGKDAGLKERFKDLRNSLWIFCNYTLLLRAMLANRKALRAIRADLDRVAYFYWGDKSAMLIPYLKQSVAPGSTKFVARFHGSDLYENAKGFLPYRRKIFKSLDYAIAISQNGAEYIRSNYAQWLHSQDALKIFPLGSMNPMPVPIMQHTRKFRIMSCSNVIPLKRVGMIAEALQQLGKNMSTLLELSSQSINGIEWVHFGDGPLLGEVKSKCNGLPSFMKVIFMGQQPHENVMDYYVRNRVDLLVQVSTSEGVPVSIMEAMSFGTPVVATNVGGVSEIVNNTNGTLLDRNLSVKNLADAIYSYLNMDEATTDVKRQAAFKTWQEHWNGASNYTAFAEFLKGL